MKTPLVSAAAVLFCCAIFAIVSFFGYSRYREAQSANAAFREQLLNGGQDQQAVLAAHMPPPLSGRPGPADAGPSASPQSSQGQ